MKQGSKLPPIFTQAVQTLYDVHSALTDAGGDGACLSNEQLTKMHGAFKAVHGAMQPEAVAGLFGHVQPDVMKSFLATCAEQCRAGFLSRHASLRDDVRPPVPLCSFLTCL